jgi:hypothetical protein
LDNSFGKRSFLSFCFVLFCFAVGVVGVDYFVYWWCLVLLPFRNYTIYPTGIYHHILLFQNHKILTMTIPMENWCELCSEACHDHPTVCTVCGSNLTSAPPRPATSRTDNTTSTTTSLTTSLSTASTLRAYLGDMRQASQDLRNVLGSLRGQVQDLEMLTQHILAQQHQQQLGEETTISPSELLWNNFQHNLNNIHNVNFGNDMSSSTRPTSQKVLDQMPRIVLDDHSTLFRQGTLQLQHYHHDMNLNRTDDMNDNNNYHNNNNVKVVNAATTTTAHSTGPFTALIGEFGPIGEHHYPNATLIVASPLTGKGGLSDKTLNDHHASQVIVFMQRGDGLTFVQKALLAQKAGASAVIIGNNTSSPWPYVMKDSNQEARTYNLSIPVVMVKEADAKTILYHYQKRSSSSTSTSSSPSSSALFCNLHITSQSHDCVVCCERLETSETVVQLPTCAHIFHENCVMAWLKSHNTCPYCRTELPTEDNNNNNNNNNDPAQYDDHESERRHNHHQRQPEGIHSQSLSSGERLSSWNEYYG